MSSAKTLAVAGAGAGNVKATAAVNLALAFAALGWMVELLDADPDRHAARALVGEGVERVLVRRGAPLEILASAAADPGSSVAEIPDIVLVDCPPRMGAESISAVQGADAVVVAVDGSALSLRALDEISAARASRGDGVRVLLTRALPRSVDRWALLDRLTERADLRLSATTVPMGRSARRSADRDGLSAAPLRRATLYAPTTSAARAYVAVARDLAADLGLDDAAGLGP